MLITCLELENVKSYGQRRIEIPFRPGVNLICGRNGSGKSTILESIGFALFDSLDYKQTQLCREGEKSGQIILSFESTLDERMYQVIRGVGKSSLKIYDPTTKTCLVDTRKDSEEWLREHLGIEMNYAKELFSNAVGVSQGKMTSSFLESARTRKTLFNPLLRVEEYENAWEKLRETKNYLEKQLAETNKIIAHLEGRLERLPQVEEQDKRLQAELLRDTATLKQTEEQLATLEEENRILKEKEELIQLLNSEISENNNELKTMKQQVERAQKEVEEAEEAATVIAQTSESYAAYEEAQRQRNELEAQRQERDHYAKALQSTEKNLAIVVTTLADLAKELLKVREAEVKALELAPLVALQTRLEEEVREGEQQVEQRQQLLERAEEKAKQLTKLLNMLTKLEAELITRTQIEQKLSSIADKQANLTKKRKELELQLSPLGEEQKEVNQQLQRAEQNKRDWENAQERLSSEEGTLKRYQDSLRHIKKELEERKRLEQVLQSTEEAMQIEKNSENNAITHQQMIRQQLKTLEQRLTILQSSEIANCPVCKRELSAHVAQELEQEFEHERDSLQRQQKEAKQNEQTAAKKLQQLKREQKSQQQALNELATGRQAQELDQSIKEQEIIVKEWQEQVYTLAKAVDEVQHLQNLQQTLNQQQALLTEQHSALSEKREELDKKRNRLNHQLLKLPQPSRADELKHEIEQAQAQKQSLEKEAEESIHAALQLEKAKAALIQLAEPRTKQAKEQAIADRSEKLKKRQAKEKSQQAKLLQQQQSEQAMLAHFNNLEGEFENNKAILIANERGYKQYIAHQKQAQTLLTREQTLSSLNEAYTAQCYKRDKLIDKKREAQQNYDLMRHQQVKKAHQQSHNQIIALQTQLKGVQLQLEKVKSELTTLQEQQKVFKATKAEVNRWTQLSEAFRFVRDGIRQAGPAVVQRRVQLISHHAGQLFQDIIEEPSYSLNWDESYGITIRARGEQRDFQQLSGGEQMAAAIAVRLALLMQMSQVRILFLDEPTSNLDEHRRDKLADRISRVKGLDQIFVITHNDSFERESHHVLRVQKENGMSIVKVG